VNEVVPYIPSVPEERNVWRVRNHPENFFPLYLEVSRCTWWHRSKETKEESGETPSRGHAGISILLSVATGVSATCSYVCIADMMESVQSPLAAGESSGSAACVACPTSDTSLEDDQPDDTNTLLNAASTGHRTVIFSELSCRVYPLGTAEIRSRRGRVMPAETGECLAAGGSRKEHRLLVFANLRRLSGMTVWALLLAAFLVLRIDIGTQENSMDERIVLAVSKGMSESSRLDPNWIFASPHYYQYPQYNFYSYNMLSHFWITLASPLRVESVVVLRIMNVLYQVAALGLVILTLRKIGIPQTGLVAAAALLTFMPGMVHDAHIARCESFLYLLFAGAMYSAASDRFLIGGLILGLGAAAKMTFLASGLLFIPALFAVRNSYPILLRRAATIGVATIVGFAVSAPYAVINFPVFITGLSRIRSIYLAHGPGPHRLLDPTPVKNVFHTVAFLTIISGSLVVSGVIAPLFNRARIFLGVWLSGVAVFVYFAAVPFFIERNFSLAIFSFAVLLSAWIGSGRARLLALPALAAALIPMAYWSIQIARSSYEGPFMRRSHWQAANVHEPVTLFWSAKPNVAGELPVCSGLLGIPDVNDDFSRRLLEYLRSTGRKEVAHYTSRFSIVPTSTLHTYLDMDMYYYTCNPEG
jgi:hypothetical protein